MQFSKATRRKAKLRLALSGPSGSGKSYSALMIAKGLGGKVAVIDTEHGSASLYSPLADFDTLELTPPYTPERYIEAIHAAEQAGYDVLIVDSITHEWKGAGGVLEIVDTLSRAKYRGNSYAAWGEADPRHRKFIDAMLQSPMHVIATMRSKTAYVEAEVKGRKTYQKAGMAPEQRDGVEYEFTVVFDLNNDGHLATASKDRTTMFTDPLVLTPEVGEQLRDWLDSGEAPAPRAAPAAQPGHGAFLDGAIDQLDEMFDGAELTALRNAVRERCERAGDRAGYARFAAALRERIAAIKEQQAASADAEPQLEPY